MKKIYFLLISSLFMSSIFATTTIKGETSLSSGLYFDSSFNTTDFSEASIDLYLLSKSNDVKYTIKSSLDFIYPSTSNSTDISAYIQDTIEQAYLQFRVPYKENYLTFNFGKTPLDIGGDWVFNSGTPFNYEKTSIFDEVTNPWIASVKTKLFELKDFQSINLELIEKLPLEDGDTKIGGRLTYDINNSNFGTVETSFLTNTSSSILSGGFNGNYFFDYGIYGKIDLQNISDFESSIFLLKTYPEFTYRFEALYTNDDETLHLLPTISYAIDTKSNLSVSIYTTLIDEDFELSPYILYQFNILQGLDISAYYFYSSITNHLISATITHKF